MKNIHNKNIVVGITGSIAAYKAADLVSKLKKAGANIKVVMTKSSTSFITERTLESISNNKVLVDENENDESFLHLDIACLLYTSPSPRDATLSRMPSSA